MRPLSLAALESWPHVDSDVDTVLAAALHQGIINKRRPWRASYVNRNERLAALGQSPR